MLEKTSFKKLSVIVSLGILAILSFLLVWPILSAIVTGLILSYILYPVYTRVLKVVKEKNISALIIVLFTLVIIILPVWFLSPILIKQVFNVYLYLQQINIFELFKSIFPSLAQTNFSQDFAASFNTLLSGVTKGIMSGVSAIFLNLPSFFLKLAVVFFILFFGLRDANIFIEYVKSLSPFSPTTERELLKKFEGVTNAVIYGFFIVGLLQGILTGIGLFIFGVPNPLPLTLLAILSSIIPVLGAWLVWVPASIYLVLSGHVVSGVFLAVYGALFVSWIDNIIRPYLIARRINLSSGIVLIGMIGGLIVFGILGLIIGPLILAYLILILDAYRKNTLPSLFTSNGTKKGKKIRNK